MANLEKDLKAQSGLPSSTASFNAKMAVEKGKFGKTDPKILRLFAGGASAFVATALTCPLDVIKTRQQSSIQFATATATAATPPGGKIQVTSSHVRRMMTSSLTTSQQPPTFLQQLVYIWRNEGVRSLFKGLSPSLIGAVSSRALFFSSYDHVKTILHQNPSTNQNPAFFNHVIAASVGGAVCTTLTCPLWVIKIRQQLHKKYNSGSLTMAQCCKQTWNKEGYRGFFRGLMVSYSGVAEMIVYFALYEKLRAVYMNQRHSRSAASGDLQGYSDLPGLMVISGFSRCVSCAACYPAEVVRVRVRQEMIQKKYCRTWDTLKKVAQTEGLRGLYGGLSTTLARQALNMAILMGVYETIIYQYRRHDLL